MKIEQQFGSPQKWGMGNNLWYEAAAKCYIYIIALTKWETYDSLTQYILDSNNVDSVCCWHCHK